MGNHDTIPTPGDLRAKLQGPHALARLCRGALAALAVGAVAVGASPAHAQQPFCVDCAKHRWDSLEERLIRTAENLKRARELVRRAQQRGDPQLIALANQHLAVDTEQWNATLLSANTLVGNTYKSYLARQVVAAEDQYDAARAELARKTAQFDKLRGALADQRERILKDMNGEIEESNRVAVELGIDATRAAVHGGAAEMQLALRGLSGAAALSGHSAEVVERAHRAADAAEHVAIGVDMGKGEVLKAGADIGQELVEIAAIGTPLFPLAVAAPRLTTLTLDAAAVGLAYHQWSQANERLEAVSNIESKWLFDMEVAKARLKNAAMARDMAAISVERQRQLEGTLAKMDLSGTTQ